MNKVKWTTLAAVVLTNAIWCAVPATGQAQNPTDNAANAPALALLDGPPSVYASPAPPREDEGVNAGGAHFDLDVAYMSAYIYRGLDYSKAGAPTLAASAGRPTNNSTPAWNSTPAISPIPSSASSPTFSTPIP